MTEVIHLDGFLSRDLVAGWRIVLDFADRAPDGWCVAGGQMVLLHQILAGRSLHRATVDLDLVIDLNARPRRERELIHHLEVHGLEPDQEVRSARRWIGDGVFVDVVTTDHARRGFTMHGEPSVEIPGARFAMSTVRAVAVSAEGRAGNVPLPSLAGALWLKAKAARHDSRPERHLLDLQVLWALVSNPAEVRGELATPSRRRELGRVSEQLDWKALGDATAVADARTAVAVACADERA